MKKIALFLIIVVMAVAMIGCSEETPAVEVAAEPAIEFVVPTGDFNEADMVFVHNGVTYPISTDVAGLIQLFGEYDEIACPSCAFVGEDKTLLFADAEVYTYPIEDVDMINEIFILGGEYTTSRGIGIGSTMDEVKAAYGENGFDQGMSYVYVVSGAIDDTMSQRLYFDFDENGMVKSFSYFGANGVIQ